MERELNTFVGFIIIHYFILPNTYTFLFSFSPTKIQIHVSASYVYVHVHRVIFTIVSCDYQYLHPPFCFPVPRNKSNGAF